MIHRLVAAVAAVFSFVAGPASVRAQMFSAGLEADFNSRYVWRGLGLSKGAVMQPSAWLAAGDFCLGAWSNFELAPEPGQQRFNEFDLTLGYGREVAGLTLEPSAALYFFPNQQEAPTTAEMGLTLGYPLGPVGFSSSHTLDVLEYRWAYYGDLGLECERELRSGLTAGGRIAAGFGSARHNEAYFGVSRAALNLVGVDASVTWSVPGLLHLRPHCGMTMILDQRLREAVDRPTRFWLGLAVSREF